MKVFHLPMNVGGNPQGISRGLKRVGVDSETWVLADRYFGYDADRFIFRASDGVFKRELKRLLTLRYVFSANVVFFNQGRGVYCLFPEDNGDSLIYKLFNRYTHFMACVELYLIKIFRKPLFVQYQGSDARQAYYCRKHYDIHFMDRAGLEYSDSKQDEAKRKRISYIEKYASRIYSLNPDLLNVLPANAQFLPYSHIALDEWLPVYPLFNSLPLRIAHAPTNRAVKGSDIVIQVCNRLIAEGINIELIMVEGMSNNEARKVYESVDILIDQLYAGWYGGLAVEAMALGKPVIAYIRENDLEYIPPQMKSELPIVNANAENLYEVLKKLIDSSPENLKEISRASRSYVERWHDQGIIAKQLKKEMENILERGNYSI